MMKKNGSRVWRVKLAICPQQLTQILSRDAPTLALIDSVRTVAKCGDPWLPRQIPFHLRTKVPIPKDVTLNSLITANGDWKINEVNSWFHKDDIPWVLGIIPSTHNPDWITWGLTNNGNASEFLWWQWEHLSKEEFIRFVGFTWLIWQRRNQFVFQHRNPNITYWVPWAIETLDQHLGLQHHDPSNSQPKSSSTWTPPPHGMLLINTDASLVQGQEGCGISAAIRNDRGALIVAKTRYIPGCMAVNLAEAAAIHLGIQLAEKWSIKNAWVASDSKIIISAIVNDRLGAVGEDNHSNEDPISIAAIFILHQKL
ncbi:hypothetical protein F8388_014822 [Cannabis sativa]|uniref:RNase H type-1 domain-containing protein n=1 Tax=Cannabis sativa TaxID=3483 RepID=A0A7J6F5W3_CANSA|nr:hypothetical protein F8388_014822 [Cannabis sativa]KAF4395515.1 hypothetical protein G4B88_010979 [Cannabis sativa]